jgi:branched-chain amino acid transport system ATP-binding protein
MKTLLGVDRVVKRFGGLVAVDNVSLSVESGEIVGLIGPNGAGKTTLLNIITGVYKPETGVIKFNGEDITGRNPSYICKKGISRTFQIVRLFPDMTCIENVVSGVIFGKTRKIDFEEARERAMKILELVGFQRSGGTLAGKLNIVEAKCVELARALATEPTLLLIDEIFAGLNPKESLDMVERIRNLKNDLGITIIAVEHIMRIIMNLSTKIVVLHHGAKLAEGEPREVASDRNVIEAYLGTKYL